MNWCVQSPLSRGRERGDDDQDENSVVRAFVEWAQRASANTPRPARRKTLSLAQDLSRSGLYERQQETFGIVRPVSERFVAFSMLTEAK